MTTVTREQLPAFRDDRDEVWEKFRARASAGDWGIPKGSYEATVMSVRVVQRRDTGDWGIRILFRADRLGLDGYAWRSLSKHADDPLRLSKSQVKSLREWAVKIGIAGSAPADIVAGAMDLVDRRVIARVSLSPVGPRASLSRLAETASGGPLVPSQAVAAASPSAMAAHEAHEQLVMVAQNMRGLWMVAAKACYGLQQSQGWQQLGYDSLNEYLAQPELGIERGVFFKLVRIWDRFHVKAGIPVERLVDSDWSKLAETVKALDAGAVTADEAVSDAAALGFRDLREKYSGGVGADTGLPEFAEFVSRIEISPVPDRDDALRLTVGDRVGLLHRDDVVRVYNELGSWLGVPA